MKSFFRKISLAAVALFFAMTLFAGPGDKNKKHFKGERKGESTPVVSSAETDKGPSRKNNKNFRGDDKDKEYVPVVTTKRERKTGPSVKNKKHFRGK